MFYLTTYDPEIYEVLTDHFATHRRLLDAAKEFMRRAMDDDERFDELVQANNAEAATWLTPDHELQFLVEKFEEELSGSCPKLLWGEAKVENEEESHEIHRLLTVSTAHVPEAMLDRLADPDSPKPMLATDEYSAWLRTGLCTPAEDLPEEDAGITAEWGPELTAVLVYARNLGCMYVRLDCDGPEYTALPTYRHR